MPFDPSIPANGTQVKAAELRGQFQGLHELITGIGAINAAQVDAVNTLNPGELASVGISVSGGTLHFTFNLPRGDVGTQGEIGSQGPGGPPGPPLAIVGVESVTTLPAGELATVNSTYNGTEVLLQFGIPRGSDGSNGVDGLNGEVTNADLATALLGTSSNSNSVSTLGSSLSDPDVDTLRQKVNELILALRRV